MDGFECGLLLFLIACVNSVIAHDKVVMCYYGTWATYRHSLGKYDVTNIDVDLCTHVVYTFAGIDDQGHVMSLDPYLDLPDNWGRDNFRKFNALKKRKATLKTILAVGGWNEGSGKYSLMASNSSYRKNFVDSAVNMLKTYGFDGLDLDWEYPNGRDTVHGAADVVNYVKLLNELRTEFDKHGYLLSAAVAATPDKAAVSYDIPVISKLFDLIGLMTYDFYGAFDSVTGHNSPLHKGEGDDDTPDEKVYSIELAINFWLKEGCPPEKLVIGLPFYGRTFTLTNPSVNGLRAPASGPGIAGDYTQTNGVIGFNEFCVKLQTQSWNVRYDSKAKVPYAVNQRNWVSYDDYDSLAVKTQYALSRNLIGVMVWSIETDDFHGLCGRGANPLLKAVNSALDGNYTSSPPNDTPVESTSTTTTTTTTTKTTTTRRTTASPIVCHKEGFMSHPSDCSSFYMCIKDSMGHLAPAHFTCPDGLHFDPANNYCNYPELAKCTV